MRLAVAIAVVGAAFAAAVYIHERHTWTNLGTQDSAYANPSVSLRFRHHPWWEDPVAVVIALGGVAIAVRIVAHRPGFANPSYY